jgi:hypothetical protein
MLISIVSILQILILEIIFFENFIYTAPNKDHYHLPPNKTLHQTQTPPQQESRQDQKEQLFAQGQIPKEMEPEVKPFSPKRPEEELHQGLKPGGHPPEQNRTT